MPASLRRIWIQVTADRKRFGVLCATLGVGLLLWARLVIVSHVPRTAVAEPPGAATADRSHSAAGKSGAPGRTADKPATKDAAKGENKSRIVSVVLSSRCQRDPFVISPLVFPKMKPAGEVKQEAGKLPTEPAEDAESRHVAHLQELLGTLKLEAAMGNSMAIIGGQRYQVGEQLPPLGKERAQFTLAEVRQRSVVLEFQGRRFELQMPLPVK